MRGSLHSSHVVHSASTSCTWKSCLSCVIDGVGHYIEKFWGNMIGVITRPGPLTPPPPYLWTITYMILIFRINSILKYMKVIWHNFRKVNKSSVLTHAWSTWESSRTSATLLHTCSQINFNLNYTTITLHNCFWVGIVMLKSGGYMNTLGESLTWWFQWGGVLSTQ